MEGPLEFVFSFRSPYAWIAARHVLPLLHAETQVCWTPFFPLPSFPNFGSVIRAKALHNLEDILRLAEAYGLAIGRPPVDEPDWSGPHSAFVWADGQGRGREFALALLEERWGQGQRVATPEAIGRAAGAVGLDPAAAVVASEDEKLRGDLVERIQRDYDERDIFGVPMFVLPDGKRFWGHDRMEWAIRYGFIRGSA